MHFPDISESWELSDAQRRRLYAIAKSVGIDSDELKQVLLIDYGLDSTKDLTSTQYEELCARLEYGTLMIARKEFGRSP